MTSLPAPSLPGHLLLPWPRVPGARTSSPPRSAPLPRAGGFPRALERLLPLAPAVPGQPLARLRAQAASPPLPHSPP